MKVLSAFVVASFVLGLIGCTGEPAETRVEQGNREQILHFGNGAEPQTLDPHIATALNDSYILQALFEGLLSQDPYTLEMIPGVAERWEVSDDNRTFTFYLRENAVWSNGDPVTAEDFRWSFFRMIDPILGNQYEEIFNLIENAKAFREGEIDDESLVGVEVLDDYTIQYRLTSPDPNFLVWLDAQAFYPVHRESVESFGAANDRLSQWTRPGNMISNGPFTLAEWVVNSHIKLEKNPTYWDAEQVKLNGIFFYPVENATTEERMFRDGQLHTTSIIPIEKVPELMETNAPELRLHPWTGTYFYTLNTTRPPLDDVRVRQALNYAIDRELIIESVMLGVVSASNSYTYQGVPGYQAPDIYHYDPDKARELLAEAGYPHGEGMRPMTLIYNTDEAHRRLAVALQQMWGQELGIKIELQNQEWKVFLDTTTNMDYDIARRGWISNVVDPFNIMPTFMTGGGNNQTGFSDPRYDEIVTRDGYMAETYEERLELVYEAEQILLEAAPIVPLYTYTRRKLVNPSVQGMPANITDFFNFRFVYLDPTKGL